MIDIVWIVNWIPPEIKSPNVYDVNMVVFTNEGRAREEHEHLKKAGITSRLSMRILVDEEGEK